jgi:hypothetical protein
MAISGVLPVYDGIFKRAPIHYIRPMRARAMADAAVAAVSERSIRDPRPAS